MLYFQEKKSQTFKSYKKDEALIKTQHSNQIKIVHSDRGGEFTSKQITQHQDQKGTIRELTVHDSPPQNGTAERGMRTHAKRARALLLASGLPCFLWEEAMRHTTWLQNHTPAQALAGQTPYKAKNKRKPHLGGIHEFGVAAYVKDLKAGKLESRAQMGRFMGYDSESKGYRIYWPQKRSVTVERNVVFNENDVQTLENFTNIQSDLLAEGERDKVIQQPENNIEKAEDPDSQSVSHPETEHKINETNRTPPPSNSVPFPSTNDKTAETTPEPEDESQQPLYGQG